jgi:hypothetical protein
MVLRHAGHRPSKPFCDTISALPMHSLRRLKPGRVCTRYFVTLPQFQQELDIMTPARAAGLVGCLAVPVQELRPEKSDRQEEKSIRGQSCIPVFRRFKRHTEDIRGQSCIPVFRSRR